MAPRCSVRAVPILLWCLLPFGAAIGARAADPATPLDLAALGSPTFTTFTAKDGVPDTTILTIGTDGEGFVWLSTSQGLVRYDGHRWEPTAVPEASARISDMYLDHEGTFWVSLLSSGISHLDRGGWHFEGPSSGLTAKGFFRVVEVADELGRLETWALSLDGRLFSRTGDRWQVDPDSEQLPHETLLGLARTREIGGTTRLWVATYNDGLWFREQGAGWRRFAAPGFDAAQVDDVLVTRHEGREELWIATYGFGLWRMTEDALDLIAGEPGEGGNSIIYRLAASTPQGPARIVWAATRGGLVRVHGTRAETFGRRHGLPSDGVRSVDLWRSPEGTDVLWAATESGVVRTIQSGNGWRTASLMGSRSNGVFGVLVEPDGHGGERLWVASSGDGLGLFEDNRWRIIDAPIATLPGSNFRLLVRAPDEEGRLVLWTAVEPGELFKITEGPRIDRVATPWPKNSGQHVLDLLTRMTDRGYELWVATRESGIYLMRNGRWEATPAAGVVGQWRVAKLLEQFDREGRSWLWATSNQGLARLDHDGWTLLGGDDLPSSDLIGLDLIPDAGGHPVLWIGSAGNGIIRLDVSDPLEPRVLAPEDLPPLPDPGVYSAKRDSQGRIYLCTNNGVQQLTPNASGGFDSRIFGRRDGILHEECNTNAQFIDDHDRFWAGTLAGLSVYDPADVVPERHPKNLLLRRVRVDGEEVNPSSVRIPPDAREVDFEAALLTWQREDETRFRWQLVGHESQPGAWVADNRRVYGKPPPGNYLLRIEGRDYADLPSRPVELPVEVLPAWWERTSVRVVSAAGLILAVAGAYRRRIRWLSTRKVELEQLVTGRTAELAAANDRLAQLSHEDALTGVANRRRFDQALNNEWRRALRAGTPLGLLLLDVDHFKAYNDTLGHQAGDACLQAIAKAIADAHLRAGELVARYGGEEFAVLLPGASRKGIRTSADTVRLRIVELGLPHPQSSTAPVVTVSVGFAWTRPEIGADPTSLLAAADGALYLAKHEGRNCTREASDGCRTSH